MTAVPDISQIKLEIGVEGVRRQSVITGKMGVLLHYNSWV